MVTYSDFSASDFDPIQSEDVNHVEIFRADFRTQVFCHESRNKAHVIVSLLWLEEL